MAKTPIEGNVLQEVLSPALEAARELFGTIPVAQRTPEQERLMTLIERTFQSGHALANGTEAAEALLLPPDMLARIREIRVSINRDVEPITPPKTEDCDTVKKRVKLALNKCISEGLSNRRQTRELRAEFDVPETGVAIEAVKERLDEALANNENLLVLYHITEFLNEFPERIGGSFNGLIDHPNLKKQRKALVERLLSEPVAEGNCDLFERIWCRVSAYYDVAKWYDDRKGMPVDQQESFMKDMLRKTLKRIEG